MLNLVSLLTPFSNLIDLSRSTPVARLEDGHCPVAAVKKVEVHRTIRLEVFPDCTLVPPFWAAILLFLLLLLLFINVLLLFTGNCDGISVGLFSYGYVIYFNCLLGIISIISLTKLEFVLSKYCLHSRERGSIPGIVC